MIGVSTRCPDCLGRMGVSSLSCEQCGPAVRGRFAMPEFLDLSPEQQRFVVAVVMARGSLKAMAEHLGISCPTARARLARVIECLQAGGDAETKWRAAILDAVEEKRIAAGEGSRLWPDEHGKGATHGQ